jgi:hypothetical protein
LPVAFQATSAIVVQSAGDPNQQQPILLVADPSMLYNVQPIYLHPPMMNASLQTQMPQQQQQQASGTYIQRQRQRQQQRQQQQHQYKSTESLVHSFIQRRQQRQQ